MTKSPADSELDIEIAALARVRRVHASHVARARAQVERLAAEAAEQTEDGIRDLVDEDAEVDAAVFAAEVRQTSARAMHAFRRLRDLEAMGEALAFGHTISDEGERLAIGRLTVLDDEEPVLVDWRADAAMPFYRATPLERHGVRRRRHLHYRDRPDPQSQPDPQSRADSRPDPQSRTESGDNGARVAEIEGYSDEFFDLDDLNELTDHAELRGEAALMASVTAPTEAQMKSVVATIQTEQDAVIRAPKQGALVVQGGPGTGKTVVALHRAAYLLYAQRAELAESGVLIVGPTSEFLAYIGGVLPSLGESGVISTTISKLYPGVLVGRDECPEVAALKGRSEMAPLLENAVRDRQRRPREDLAVWYGARRVVVTAAALIPLFERARRHRAHNDGADAFRFDLIEHLSEQVADPSFGNLDDARRSFRRSSIVRRFLLRHWPPLSPAAALNDLFGSRALLRSAARLRSDAPLLSSHEVDALVRDRSNHADLDRCRWTDADIPLLDELLVLLGGAIGGQTDEERERERDAADEFELAAASEARGEIDLDEGDDVDDGWEFRREGVSVEEFGAAGFAIDNPVFVPSSDPLGGIDDRLAQELGLDPSVIDQIEGREHEHHADG